MKLKVKRLEFRVLRTYGTQERRRAQNERRDGIPDGQRLPGAAAGSPERVDVLEERIACIRMMLTDRAVHMNQVRVRCSADPQKNERLIAQIDELEREKAAAEKERDRIYGEVQAAIVLIREPKAQEILIRHYLDGLNWS